MSFEGSPPLLAKIWEHQNAVLQRVSRGGPYRDVLGDIVRLAEDGAPGGDRATLLLVSEDGRRLVDGTARGLPPSYLEAVDGTRIVEGAGSCGTAAARKAAVFTADIATDPLWKSHRDLARKHGLKACWSVPVLSSTGTVLGVYANYFTAARAPSQIEMAAIQMIGQSFATALERQLHERARDRAERDRLMLAQELNHRVKNAFTISQSIVSMSARDAEDPRDLARVVNARLRALSVANDVAVSEGRRTDLADLLGKIMAPYLRGDAAEAEATAQGPLVELAAEAARSLALILHELATNAAKYGALSHADGQVHVSWWEEEDTLRILWREVGGPAVIEPAEMGFGSRLIRDAVERQLLGQYEKTWNVDGLVTRIALPLASLTAA